MIDKKLEKLIMEHWAEGGLKYVSTDPNDQLTADLVTEMVKIVAKKRLEELEGETK